MEKHLTLPGMRYTVSALAGILVVTLVLTHPGAEAILALAGTISFFAVLGMALGERLKAVRYTADEPHNRLLDGGSFPARPTKRHLAPRTGAPLRGGDGGTFPRRVGAFREKN